MASALKNLFEFVIWVFVPFILLFVVYRSYQKSTDAEDDKHRRGALRSGFWGGIVLFVMTLIYQVNGFIQNGFPVLTIYQGFDVWLALSAAIVGFFISATTKRLLPTRFTGVGILLATFLASSALVHYIFIRTYNQPLLSIILGLTFGMLMHFTTASTTGRGFKRSFSH